MRLIIFSLNDSIWEGVTSLILGMAFLISEMSNWAGEEEDSSLEITDGYSEVGSLIWLAFLFIGVNLLFYSKP
jgi:hypothetical protein